MGPSGTRKDATGQETPAPAPKGSRKAFIFILDAFVLFSLNSNLVESCLFSFTFLARLHLSSSPPPWPGSLRNIITFDDNKLEAVMSLSQPRAWTAWLQKRQGTREQAPSPVDWCFCQLTCSEKSLGKQTLQFCLENANVRTSTDKGIYHLLTIC